MNPEWISIKERLPEYSCIVLVTDGKIVTFSEFDYSFSYIIRPYLEKVTHWTPLPEPPDAD
jgi:hypothetical protein